MGTAIQRQALTQHDLVDLLNFELAAYEECQGCHFTSIQPLAAPGGTQWDAKVQADHPLSVEEQFIVGHVVSQTREQFDLGRR